MGIGKVIREPRKRIRVVLDTGKLQGRRLELGLTVIEVGRRAGLGKTAIYNAFRLGDCGAKAARRISKVLGLDLAELWLDGRTLRPWRPGEGTRD